MCSIFKYRSIVGRNFDYEVSYNEELRVINPADRFDTIYRVVGMCTGLVKDYPLLYDGMNEHGLVCGGLAFTGNAVYNSASDDRIDKKYFDVSSWGFLLKILGNYKTVDDVKSFLKVANITDEAFSEEMPPSDLHWFVADKDESIIVEQTNEGLNWYDGDVMTNNPPYWLQKNWRAVEKWDIGKKRKDILEYNTRGKNTYNLKGDYTSMGRFQRLSWLKKQLEESDCSFDDVSQGFHLLSSVEQIYGATPVEDKFEYTIYSIVYDMERMKVFLRRYDDVYGMEWDL